MPCRTGLPLERASLLAMVLFTLVTSGACGGDDDSGPSPADTSTPDAAAPDTSAPDQEVSTGDTTADTTGVDAGPAPDATAADTTDTSSVDATPDVSPDVPDPDATSVPDGTPDAAAGDADQVDAEEDTAEVTPDTADAGPTPTGPVPAPGDLVITEIMVDPSGISDADGEWLEIHNTSDLDLEIGICELSDLDNDSAYLGGADPIFIPAGAIWVLGSQPDTTLNGGVTLDLVYPPTFWLSNSADEVQITCLGEVVDSVVYDSASWPLLTGRSLSLDPEAEAEAGAGAWCPAPNLYSVGNYGSPGAANPPCPEPDTTIDDCILALPTSVEIPEGADLLTSALIYDEGVTDVTTGVDAAIGLLVEAGYGPAGSDPSAADASWSWQSAGADPDWIDAPNPDYDQYILTIEAPSSGDHLVSYRVSLDAGSSWTYCDNTGSQDGFSAEALGTLTTGPDPCEPNPCQDDPAPFCEGDTLVTNAGQGTCTPDGLQPSCSYDQTLTDCAFLGGSCDSGACKDLAAVPASGELVITEVMKDPDLVGDAEGEWFEVANITDKQLNLSGCELLGVAEDVEHVIDADGALLAQPGDHLVLARDGDSTINGGVTAHYVYAGVSLGNGGDTITVRCGGVVIDSVSWDGAYPDDSGAAMQLSPDLTDATSNDDIDSWCGAPQTFGDGDYGSPGLPNPPCYVDPCADVTCPETFPPTCSDGTGSQGDGISVGETAVTYSGGACVEGTCVYDETYTDCVADGLTCWFGECMTAAEKACEVYCGLLNGDEYCTGDSEIDFGESTCLEVCDQYPSQAGFVFFGPEGETIDYPASGDTLECRLHHIWEKPTGDPTIDCAAAAPDGGGVCVDPCEGVVCDDALPCTDDACVDGECSFTLGAESCLIEDACYGPGDANPADPCTTCQPANDANIWTESVDGDACGDLGETCQAGACLTVCEVLDCDDALPCTADGCVDGACAYETDAAACLIEGACYGDGDLNDANPCGLCDPAQAQADWSAVADTTACGENGETCVAGACLGACDVLDCDDSLDCTTDSCAEGLCQHALADGACAIEGACYVADDTPAPGGSPCHSCQPDTATDAWSPLADDTSCGDAGETCQAGECLPSCETLTCDDGLDCTDDSCADGACVYTPQADACIIEGACVANGAVKADDPCLACSAGDAQDTWTGLADDSSCGDDGETCQGGVCLPSCENLDCSDGLDCTTDTCDSGLCSSSLDVGFCLIAGVCAADGDVDPDNACQGCGADAATDAWTTLADDTSCGDNAETCQAGVCVDPCDALDCSDDLECTTDTCVAGECQNDLVADTCLIDGACLADGDLSDSNPCEQCSPAALTDAWSSVENGAQCQDDAHACEEGACVHLCDLTTCDAAPADFCTGGDLTSHTASCEASGGVATCIYTPSTASCFPAICSTGACEACGDSAECAVYDAVQCPAPDEQEQLLHTCDAGECVGAVVPDPDPAPQCTATAYLECDGDSVVTYDPETCVPGPVADAGVGCAHPLSAVEDCEAAGDICVEDAADSAACFDPNAVCAVDGDCDTPPGGSCEGLVATTWDAAGICGELLYPNDGSPLGDCSYAETTEDCGATDFACTAGVCTDPCADALCETAPAGTCDGDTLTTYSESGTCTPGAGLPVCTYDSTAIDCTATDSYCGTDSCVPTNRLLVINEFDYDMDGPDDPPEGGGAEFIEVLNPSSYTIPLESLRLQAINGNEGVDGDLPLSAILDTATDGTGAVVTDLAPGGYLVVGMPAALTGLPADVLRISHEGSFLQNSEEAVRLVETSDGVTIDAIIDAVSYEGVIEGASEGDEPAPTDSDDPGSLGRCPNGADTNENAVDFILTQAPTPGLPNACDVAPPAPTYTDDVQPIYETHCGGCHTSGSSGGTSFGSSYEEAIKPASPPPSICDGLTVAECAILRIQDGSMPPGGGGSVTAEELDTLQAWIDAGSPE